MHFRIILLILAFLTNSCTTIQRSARSGYAPSNDRYLESSYNGLEENYYVENEPTVQSLIVNPLANDLKLVRIGLEKRLTELEEKRQYSQFKSLMNEQERIAFLQLTDIYDRDRWLEENGFDTPEKRHTREVSSLIEKNDIALGMSRLAVKDSWGDPDEVDIAGNSANGNERWKFTEALGTLDGFKVVERTVYFEKGKVIGWTTK